MGFLFSFISLLISFSICSKTPHYSTSRPSDFLRRNPGIYPFWTSYATIVLYWLVQQNLYKQVNLFCNALRSLVQHIEYSGNLWDALKRKVSKLGFLNATSATGYVAFYVLFSLTVRAIPHLILAVYVNSHNTD